MRTAHRHKDLYSLSQLTSAFNYTLVRWKLYTCISEFVCNTDRILVSSRSMFTSKGHQMCDERVFLASSFMFRARHTREIYTRYSECGAYFILVYSLLLTVIFSGQSSNSSLRKLQPQHGFDIGFGFVIWPVIQYAFASVLNCSCFK